MTADYAASKYLLIVDCK